MKSVQTLLKLTIIVLLSTFVLTPATVQAQSCTAGTIRERISGRYTISEQCQCSGTGLFQTCRWRTLTRTPITETQTPTPTPTRRSTQAAATPTPPATSLFYNLPPARLTSPTGLYASPNRGEFIVPATIPAGETVYVMGRNATSTHMRVVWNTGVGWVPVSFTDYNGRRDRMAPLPIFTREPPACAIPVTTQFGLNSKWTSNQRQRIAVIIDLFRSQYGEFPRSFLSLEVNGQAVDSSRRQIVEQGQFSLKDVVFTLPRDLQAGDRLGYILETTSQEPLTFMSTIFSIPQRCQWNID
ncbi:MAG: hypothetical protein KF893_23010 [Caldilineaceae bacterium]|nr:hypothetical protein [Caldilineaceae bacterium]